MHKTIGIVGGLSPESTANYYLKIVRRHFEYFQNRYYPSIKIASVCTQQYVDWRLSNRWDLIAEQIIQEVTFLADAGADFALVACNTMHKVFPLAQSPIPILSIVDVAASEIRNQGINTLVLTGTQFTMADGFLSQQLSENGIHVVTPGSEAQSIIERIIKTELVLGTVSPESATEFAQIVYAALAQDSYSPTDQRAGVLLACTELGMLLPHLPADLNGLDTAEIHAIAAWEIATGQRVLP